MRSRHLLLVFLASVFLFAMASQPAAGAQAAAVLTIRDLGSGMIEVDGNWQFHTGDDLGWADPAFDDSAWEHIKADDTWGAQTHPAYAGFAWYRRHLEITRSAVSNQQLAILMPPVDDAYELYWNGQKIGKQGQLPPDAVWYYGHRQSFALALSPSGATDGVLAVRVWKAPLNSVDPAAVGGLNALPVIGDARAIAAKVGQGDFARMRSGLYGRAISFFFLLIGVVSFLAWFQDRSKRLYLWFALWLVAKIALFYLSSDRVIEWISATTFGCSLLALHTVENCSIFLLLLYLFNLQENRRLRRWTWIIIGVNVGLGLADAAVLFFWVNAGPTMQWLDAVLIVLWTLCQLFIFVLLYRGFRFKPDLSRKMVAATVFMVYVHEIVRIGSVQGQRFTGWTLYSRMSVPLFHFAGAGITSRQILETLLLISLAYALAHYAMEQRRHTAAIEMELKSAQEVQQVMIPEALPAVAGYAIESIYQSALEVGGDFFQIIPLADESTLVVLGDVSGKGLKAAMNVALIVGTLRTLAEFSSSPAAMLNGLNRRLVGRLQGGFATTVAFRLVSSGDCTIANAGHLPPFLNSSEMTLGPSLPLGIDPDTEYEDEQIALQDEDRLTLYTDGVLEATNEDGELYGFERVSALLADRPDAASIAATAQAFGQEDDITVLTITKLLVDHNVEASSVVLATG